MTKYTFALGNASVQNDGGELYQVPMQTYINSLPKWKNLPILKEHDGQELTKINNSFMNTTGYKNYNGEDKPATFLPSIDFELGDQLSENEKQRIKGVSNAFKIVKYHIANRQAGFNNVKIVDEIEPLNVALLINADPNYRECDIKVNQDKKDILTLNEKQNQNNKIDFMAEEIKEEKKEENKEENKENKCNEDGLAALHQKLDKILSLLEKNNEDKADDKKEDKKNEDKEEDKQNEDKEEDKQNEDKEEDKQNEDNKEEDKTNEEEKKNSDIKYIYTDLF